MPAPKLADDQRRRHLLRVRMNDAELARLDERRGDVDRSEYVRDVALRGEVKGGPAANSRVRRALAPKVPLARADRGAEAVRAAAEATVVEAEVAEAKMGDEAARESWVGRRALQLKARYPTMIARRMAEREWEERGRA